MKKAENLLNGWYEKSEQVAPVRIRTFSREKLVSSFKDFGFTIGAEVGVDRGTFSKVILDANPDLNLFCVDPWRPVQDGVKRYEQTQKKLKPYETRVKFMRETSLEAARQIDDESLDFVYIDGDHHFDYAMTDIIEWSKKVKVGGIVSGHDYYHFRQAGVIEAVDVYTKMHKIEKWFLTDYLKDRTPSFFWIKQDEPWSV